MDILWKTLCTASAAWLLTTGSLLATTDGLKSEMKMEKSLNLTHEWDKVFPLSNKVNHRKVTFTNRYGITLAADMYVPKQAEGKLPAIAVSGPFGAVKEQSSGLYAMTLAERGFLTIAFDPSYTGESGGEPRYVASPDINTEDFCAAVDFLSICEQVDADRIGILYNPQIQISAESETKRSIFREKDKTKRSKKESAQHSKSRNKSFVMTSVSAL